MSDDYQGSAAHLCESLKALGLPPAIPEPEVTKRAVENAQTRALTSIIGRLIGENEPLLSASPLGEDGRMLLVRVRGSSEQFKITVEPQCRG